MEEQLEEEQRSSLPFLDGCHRYGWVITLIINLLVLAYLSGGVVTRIDDLSLRIDRLERVIDSLNNVTRGLRQ